MVRRGSAKAVCVGSIPTLASKFCCLSSKELCSGGVATVSESVSELRCENRTRHNSPELS